MEHVTDMPLTCKGQGTITTTGASQAAAPGMTGRGYLVVLNTHVTDPVYLRFDGEAAAADADSFKLPAGAASSKPVAAVELVKLFGTGPAVSWSFDVP